MDNFTTLIENIVSRKIAESSFNKSIPCVVREVISENEVVVEAVPTGTAITVPNWSGSAVKSGEKVQVFYNGNLALNSGAYIGASINKEVEIEIPEPVHVPVFQHVAGDFSSGGIISTGTELDTVGFKITETTNCTIFLNFTIVGTESNEMAVKISFDGTDLTYVPKFYLDLGKRSHFSCAIPITAVPSNLVYHIIRIKCLGMGYIENANYFVSGTDITKYSVPASYVSGYASVYFRPNSWLICYYGIDKNPNVPKTVGLGQLKKLLAVSFDHSEVERVNLPEGLEEIE